MKILLAAALLLASPAGAEPNAPPETTAAPAMPAAPGPMDAIIRQAIARAHLIAKQPEPGKPRPNTGLPPGSPAL